MANSQQATHAARSTKEQGPTASLATVHELRNSDTPADGIVAPVAEKPSLRLSPDSLPVSRKHTPSLSQSTARLPDRPSSGLGARYVRQSSGDYFGVTGTAQDMTKRDRRSSQSVHPVRKVDPAALLKMQTGIVKSRSGSVLGRGFILKNDRLPPRSTHSLDFRLKGAPNFRSGGEGIFGSAQPSITGLRTVLSTLGCHPDGSGRAVWICTREEPVVYIGGSPYVLRDAQEPLRAYALSDRPEALESIEKRLKADILQEAARYGGLVQVQEEIDDRGSEDSGMASTWVAASEANVMTIRELWQSLKDEGFSVDYHRIAISSDENPANQYLDAFLGVLRDLDTGVSVYFNCGVGVVRTTFAMTMALLVRRHQSISADRAPNSAKYGSGNESVIDRTVQKNLIDEANAIDKRNRTLLRLTSVLNACIPAMGQHNVLQMLMTQPQVLENLRLSVDGDYDIILNLLSCLEAGKSSKSLADAAINRCDAVINLREDILNHRINLALAASDDAHRELHLRKALAGLERYFFLVAFASFIAETDVRADKTYSQWLEGRAELRNMAARLMKPPNAAAIFAPVADLTALSRDASLGAGAQFANSRFGDVTREGNEVIGDEFAAQLVRRRKGITLRAGMILKKDIWHDALEDGHESNRIRGALNFRRIPDSNIYALSQPTDSGIVGVLERVEADSSHRPDDRTTWVNLREEPLCYINGAPYVLREESLSLRNLKSYAGISASRLELIEDRLKLDVLAELKSGDGRILLHTERADGTVVSVWESVEPDQVATLREVMDSLSAKHPFNFRRIPITAEGPPNFADISEMVEIVSLSPVGHSVVVNCQLGRGRSTLVSVMLVLFKRWLENSGRKRPFAEAPPHPPRVLAYAVINNLIRVIRNGREIKMHVDAAIQQCSEIYNLLDAIENSRQEAQSTEDDKRKQAYTRRGTDDLRRYFVLVLFAAWLNESSGEDLQSLREEQSFKRYVKDRPVFQTILKEIDAAGPGAIQPLVKSTLAEEVASDEVEAVVARRNGRILSTSTILKSDFFSNLQKLSLPERVDGAPNYRRTSIFFDIGPHEQPGSKDDRSVYGTGMPTVDGLRRALEKMGAGPSSQAWVYWTLMREEPVIFVRGRPHVLRLLAMPLENVITTGVTAESVEGQESALKSDVLREIQKHEGRLLLHDETDDGNGHFTLTAQWEEDLTAADVLTPKDVYEKMMEEGYKVNYARLPVTDEQSPIPHVFARLEERVEEAFTRDEVALAFNCQMGRGRTTTAMVAASLVATILHPDEQVYTPRSELPPATPAVNETFEIREIQDPYLQGEYKIIFQLMSVLQHGKLAKLLADRAIDQCEAVQNLRKAVATYKLQWESAEKGSSKKEKVANIAFNYLYRYGTLIAFANYLLEKRDAQSGALSSSISLFPSGPNPPGFPSFPDYLRKRSEIGNILSRKSLD